MTTQPSTVTDLRMTPKRPKLALASSRAGFVRGDRHQFGLNRALAPGGELISQSGRATLGISTRPISPIKPVSAE